MSSFLVPHFFRIRNSVCCKWDVKIVCFHSAQVCVFVYSFILQKCGSVGITGKGEQGWEKKKVKWISPKDRRVGMSGYERRGLNMGNRFLGEKEGRRWRHVKKRRWQRKIQEMLGRLSRLLLEHRMGLSPLSNPLKGVCVCVCVCAHAVQVKSASPEVSLRVQMWRLVIRSVNNFSLRPVELLSVVSVVWFLCSAVDSYGYFRAGSIKVFTKIFNFAN